MYGVNDCTFIGNLTRDPEQRYTKSGKLMATFGVAVNEYGDDVTFIDVTVFNEKTAEFVGQYLKKGDQVYVRGSLQIKKDQKDPSKKYTNIVVSAFKGEVRGLGKKNETAEVQDENDGMPF